MTFAESFGNALSTLKVDTSNTDVPKSTIEIVNNVLSNLQTKGTPSLNSNESSNQSNNNSSKSTSSTQATNDSTPQKPKLSVWKLLKVSLLLAFTFILLSTEFFKNLMTKVTNNHIISISILAVIFIMISFCSMKWML